MGNVRAALFNWLFAKRHGGAFILRFDDTDRTGASSSLLRKCAGTTWCAGPEMAKLLPLIGRAKASARLSGLRA